MSGVFASRTVVAQAWYVLCRSSELRRGSVRSWDALGRRVAAWRDDGGAVHVLDARCPHLGADLGHGAVTSSGVRCAFHHWTIGADGVVQSAPECVVAPRRRVRRYPAVERFGLVFFFNGATPTLDPPEAPPGGPWRAVALPTQRLACHPHLVLGNGLDVAHLGALHDFELTMEPELSEPSPQTVAVRVAGRPRSQLAAWLTGSRQAPVVAEFRATGGSVAWAHFEAPRPFHVLFTGRGDRDLGACVTQTVVFVRSLHPGTTVPATALLWSLLRSDRRILESLDFAPAFTKGDEGLRRWASVIDKLETA